MLSIINNSAVQDDFIKQLIETALDSYVFPGPGCDVEIVACRDRAELRTLIIEHLGEETNLRDYDGNFLCPHSPEDPYRILVTIKEEALLGARRYFNELKEGSRRDADLPREERERRGIDFANFCHFLEMVQHEYSHLCSYEKLMSAGEDPEIGNHSIDYHLYDEEIARYRGTYSMLQMMEPYAERDLLYTLWMGYWDDLLSEFKEYGKTLDDYLRQQYEGIAEMTRGYMRAYGLTPAQIAEDFESELGHPLEYGGEISKLGIPKLSKAEVAEYLMVDDEDIAEEMYRHYAPLLYHAKNPYATYEGAQVVGIVHAFYDFLRGERRDYDLQSLMEKPYYETVDADKARAELEEFPELFMKRA